MKIAMLVILGAMITACQQADVLKSQSPIEIYEHAPHIVVLIADDLGLDVAPCHDDRALMPHLEARCDSALVFRRAYSHPYCTASRATLMTGRHPHRHGADDVRSEAIKLPLSEITLAEIIKANSRTAYQTATFGKWHLADDQNGSAKNPNLQGFDHFEGTPRQHHTYRYFDYDWFFNGELLGRREEYKTTFITNRVLNYFREQTGSEPIFSIVSYTNPHKPYHIPPNDLHSRGDLPPLNLRGTLSDNPGPGEYRANRREPTFDPYYYAMLEAFDLELERLVSTLTKESDRPIVFVFLGDNGSAAEVLSVSDRSLIRSKATLYDGGVRVPLMIWSSQSDSYPIRTGHSDRLIHLVDLFSTVSELAGVPIVELNGTEKEIDSKSFTTTLFAEEKNAASNREFVFLERGNDERLPFAYGAVNRNGLKLILREPKRQTSYSRDDLIEIYDTERDPWEVENLIHRKCGAAPERVLELFAFISEVAERNTAHSNWFDPDAYKTDLERSFSDCPPAVRN